MATESPPLVIQRCRHCGRALPGEWPLARLTLWGMFRIPAKGVVIEPTGAITRRCRPCGFISVFVIDESKAVA